MIRKIVTVAKLKKSEKSCLFKSLVIIIFHIFSNNKLLTECNVS